MKLIFTFTDSSDLKTLSKADIFTTSFEMPDEALHLIGVKERVLAIAEMAGRLTRSALHLSCKELELKNYPIKLDVNNLDGGLYGATRSFILCFERYGTRNQRKQLKILLPVPTLVPQAYFMAKRRKSLKFNLIGMNYQWHKSEDEEKQYALIAALAEQCCVLLNAEPAASPHVVWRCAGFHPYWIDNSLIDRVNKRSKIYRAEQRKQERAEKKRQEAESKRAAKLAENQNIIPSSELPKTGAGRRPGAILGIFKGVQFRSQLEIRFATELESRGIRWVYEPERIGDGQYLVDFYLPDCGCWVEVKGRFEPRDDYLLKDAAAYLNVNAANSFLFTHKIKSCRSI